MRLRKASHDLIIRGAGEAGDGKASLPLGQAGRIPGVWPSDLQSLLMEVLKQRRSRLDLPLEDPVPD